MGRILINCDLGENELDEQTEKLLALVDAANICCGVHAGSEAKTRRTIQLALERGLLIGAHPGLPDAGGRGSKLPEPDVLRRIIERQLLQFIDFADSCEARVSYVKLHGSLYHAVEQDADFAAIYLQLLRAVGPGLGVFALAGGSFQKKAKSAGFNVWEEIFADRAYRCDGLLVQRSHPAAILGPDAALGRLARWFACGSMETHNGALIRLGANTVCVHSDSPDAESLLAGIRELMSV